MTTLARDSRIAPASSSPLFPLLALGGGLVFMTFMRFSLAELAWVVFAPVLAYLHRRPTIGGHLAVLATLVVAFLAAIAKMATVEIPWVPVPMFAVPIALSYFAAAAFAGLLHRRLGARWGIYGFASMAAVLGWLQYTYTPGSSWGVLAHTQLDNLPLVQLAALTGLGGVTFLVALGSGIAAAAWTSGLRAVRADLAVLGLLLAAALSYGHLRLGRPAPGASLPVGSVVSPLTHVEFRAAHQNVDSLRRFDDELFSRTARAADLGAKIIVWNENATLVTRATEAALVERGQAFARARGALLLMAYGVFDTAEPTPTSFFVNKYRLYGPDGVMLDEYVKRHPVPGDPNPAGSAHARVVTAHGARVSGGICYDYGFPETARSNAADGAGLVLVPASDWVGIDPEHGRMALMNAVAVGLPMVRPVRAATSFASDQVGRVLASQRADGQSDGVMIASVPTERVQTLYAWTGEVVPLLALTFCVLGVFLAARARRTTALARPVARAPLSS